MLFSDHFLCVDSCAMDTGQTSVRRQCSWFWWCWPGAWSSCCYSGAPRWCVTWGRGDALSAMQTQFSYRWYNRWHMLQFSVCVRERETDRWTDRERERKRCIHLILNKLFELCFVPVIALMNDWFVQAVYTSSLNNKFI